MIESPSPAIDRYAPSPAQLARIEARRRFNRLYVYLPIGVCVLAIMVLAGMMLWVIFGTEDLASSSRAQMMSGLADLVIIGAALPLILFSSLLPLTLVGVVAYRRQKRQADSDNERGEHYGRFQTVVWKVEDYLDIAQEKIVELTPKLAKPLIQFNAFLAYIETVFNQIFRRSRK